MKKVTFLLFFIAILISIKAQNFIPIPEDTTSCWKIYGDDVLDEECHQTYTDWFNIMGERIVNNKTYYKLYSKGHWVSHPIMPNGSCSGEGNTLNVGDTVPSSFYFIQNVYGVVIVSSIDSAP